jgi:uncharacterized membrane-anchored protein
MSLALLIANVERAGNHAVVLGVLVLVAAAGGLVYGLMYLVRSRARSKRGPEGTRGQGPEERGPAA